MTAIVSYLYLHGKVVTKNGKASPADFVMPDGNQQTMVYDGKKTIVTLIANN